MEKKQEIKKFIEKRMIKQIGHIDPISDFWIETILAYNLDRESPLVTGTAEESESLIKAALDFCDKNKFKSDIALPQYFMAGAQWQVSAQSTTIERLTKALEDIAYGNCHYGGGLVKIAREALNSIKH